jgi:hypothetical protein
MQTALSPLYDILTGEDPRGDTPTVVREGVWGGVNREGYNKTPPVNYEGGGCVEDRPTGVCLIYTSNSGGSSRPEVRSY